MSWNHFIQTEVIPMLPDRPENDKHGKVERYPQWTTLDLSGNRTLWHTNFYLKYNKSHNVPPVARVIWWWNVTGIVLMKDLPRAKQIIVNNQMKNVMLILMWIDPRLKRVSMESNKELSPLDVNSAFSFRRSHLPTAKHVKCLDTILLFRAHEWKKILLHETMHILREPSLSTKYSDLQIRELHRILPNIPLAQWSSYAKPEEAKCEMLASLWYHTVLCQIHRLDLLPQINKVIEHLEQTWNTILKFKPPSIIHVDFLSYFVVKWILLTYYCIKTPLPTFQDFIFASPNTWNEFMLKALQAWQKPLVFEIKYGSTETMRVLAMDINEPQKVPFNINKTLKNKI